MATSTDGDGGGDGGGDRLAAFLRRLDRLPPGYGEGRHAGRRWGVTYTVASAGRRRWLYGEQLGGTDRVSFNLYLLAGGRPVLRPCEMPAGKVINFVLGYRPDVPPSALAPRSDIQ